MNYDDSLKLMAAIAVGLLIIGEWRARRRYVIRCDEGEFICTRRFFGGEPIYRKDEDCWWIWPDPLRPDGIIIAHHPRILSEK